MSDKAENEQRHVVVMCPRCKHPADATAGVPWERHDGTWEWIRVTPHLHGRTGNSTCRPKGYARHVRSTPATTGGDDRG